MPQAKTKRKSARKATKLQLRLQSAEKTVLSRAAALRRTSLSNFMLEHAYAAAQEVLAEQTEVVMPAKQWEAFCKALDAPPRAIPALRKLLNQPSVFDGQGRAAGQ